MKINEGAFTKDQLRNLRSVVRPVGPWRFLTPVDTIQEGDLFRVVAVRADDEDAAFNANWSPVGQDGSKDLIGTPVCEGSNRWEIIRALEHGYTVPMFDIPPTDGDEARTA